MRPTFTSIDYVDFNIQDPRTYYLVKAISHANERLAYMDWFTSRQRPTIYLPESVLGHDFINMSNLSKVDLDIIQEMRVIHAPKDLSKTFYDTDITDPSSEFMTYGVLVDGDNVTLCKLTEDASVAPYRPQDRFLLYKEYIPSFTSDTPETTNVGRFFWNYLLGVEPFVEKNIFVPYQNRHFLPAYYDGLVKDLIISKKITRKEYNRYVLNGYVIGTEGSTTPTWSEKSLQTDPKIIAKRDEILKENAQRLAEDPAYSAQIEQELIKMDKEYIKGDRTEAFYMADPGKAFDDQRKKMYFAYGIAPSFSKEANKFEYTRSSLGEGWSRDDIANAANAIRRGSYGRGKETAKGGEQTKFLMRIFQNTHIVEDDCGTKEGLAIKLTPYNYKIWVGRYDLKNHPYTEEELKAAVGTTIYIRSPMYCKSKNGHCKKCCGKNLEAMDITEIGLNSLSIGSGMTSSAMKSMHSSAVKPLTIVNFSRFLVK